VPATADGDVQPLLPEIDREFLEEKGYVYRVIPAASGLEVVIENFDLAPAYSPSRADLMIILPAGYPNATLDMFWTYPDVKLRNGNWPERCEHHEIHNERNWQRWSRHFVQPWRPGSDTLRTFITSIRQEITRGI